MANRSVSVLMTLKGGTRGSIFQADLLNNARTVWPRTTKFGRITQVGRSVFLGGHPCPYRKGAMSQRSPTFGVPFHIWNAYTLLLSTSKFDVATHVGRGLFLGCQSRPIPRVRGPSAPQFFSAYTYTLYRRTTKFDVVTHVVEGHLFWGQPRLHPKRAEFQGSSIFGFSSIYALHPLTQNDQTRHGVTYGEGRVLGGQLHRCICTNASRGFVSDSWLSCFSKFTLIPVITAVYFSVEMANRLFQSYAKSYFRYYYKSNRTANTLHSHATPKEKDLRKWTCCTR